MLSPPVEISMQAGIDPRDQSIRGHYTFCMCCSAVCRGLGRAVTPPEAKAFADVYIQSAFEGALCYFPFIRKGRMVKLKYAVGPKISNLGFGSLAPTLMLIEKKSSVKNDNEPFHMDPNKVCFNAEYGPGKASC